MLLCNTERFYSPNLPWNSRENALKARYFQSKQGSLKTTFLTEQNRFIFLLGLKRYTKYSTIKGNMDQSIRISDNFIKMSNICAPFCRFIAANCGFSSGGRNGGNISRRNWLSVTTLRYRFSFCTRLVVIWDEFCHKFC